MAMAPLSCCYGFLVSVVALTSDNKANAWTSPKALTRRKETRLKNYYAEERYSRPPRDEYYQDGGGYYFPEQENSNENGNEGYDGQYNSYEYDINQRRQARSPQENNYEYQGYNDRYSYGYYRQEAYQQRRDDDYYSDNRMENSMNPKQDYGAYYNDGYGDQRGQPLVVPQENYDDYQRYDDNNPYGYDNRDYEQQRRENDDYYSDRRAGGSLSRQNSWFDDDPFSMSPFPSMLSPMMFGASMLDSFFSPFSSPFGRRRRSLLSPFARMDAMMQQMMGPSMGDMMRQQQEQMRAQRTENIQDLLDEALTILQSDPVVRHRVPGGPIDVVKDGNPILSQSSSSAMVVDINGEQRQTQRTQLGVRLNNNQWSLWLATEGGRLQEATLVDNTDPTNPINVPVPGAAAVDDYNPQQLPESEADPTTRRGWRNVLPSPSNNERPSRPRRKTIDNDDDVMDVEVVEV